MIQVLTSRPRYVLLLGGGFIGVVDDPLEPINSAFASSIVNDCQCLPEGRLDVVDVGENGEMPENIGTGSGMDNCGGDFE